MRKGKIKISKYSGTVRTGFPSPAMDYLEERIDLNKELITHPVSTFIVESTGDSMIQAFIPQNSKLIIDRSVIAQSGDIVLAVVNGEFTVKFLRKSNGKIFLVPANKKYKEIEITEEMNMQIWGVVQHIIIDAKNLRKCML